MFAEEQRQLCLAAQSFTSANGMKEDEPLVNMASYRIAYSWTREGPESVVALSCPNTSPALFIHMRNWEYGEIMIFSENEFLDKEYEFTTEIMEHVHQLGNLYALLQFRLYNEYKCEQGQRL